MSNLLEKASIITTPTAYSEGFINSVKPEQTLGSELVINGDFATDSDWTLESGWSISNGKLVGTLSNSTNAYQEKILEAGKKYKITYEITNYTQGGVRFQFVGGSTVNGLSRNGLGTYTEYLTATDSHNRIRFRSLSADGGFTGSIDNVSVKEVIDADFTFTRNNIGTRVNASGNIESVGVDLPRINYEGGSGSWLFEPQSQNLIDYSEDFSQGYFTLTNASVSSSTITDPTENQNSFKLIPDNGTGGNRSIGRSFINLTGLHTFTCFAKKAEYNYLMLRTRNGPNTAVMFNLDNGTFNVNSTSAAFVSAEIDDYGNGWYRCSVTLDPSQMANVGQLFVSLSVGITGNETNSFSGDGLSGVYIFGMQFEEKSYQTSYIPTNGSPVTRAADSAINAGSSDLISSTEGVFYAELKNIAEYIDGQSSISINDGSATNRIMFFKSSGNNRLVFQIKNASETINFTSATTNVGFDKVAIKWVSTDTYAFWVNGVEVAGGDLNGTQVGMNNIDFSADDISNPFQGNVKCVAVFKEALTDAELTCLTTI